MWPANLRRARFCGNPLSERRSVLQATMRAVAAAGASLPSACHVRREFGGQAFSGVPQQCDGPHLIQRKAQPLAQSMRALQRRAGVFGRDERAWPKDVQPLTSRVAQTCTGGSTMKTLFLVRHAKSSRDDASLPDRDRPLNDRGMQDAPMMGQRLAGRGVKPDLMLSSPALRALTTAQLLAKALGCERGTIVVDDRLYASSANTLLGVIGALGNKLNSVMLFGHNPEFSALANRLSNDIVDLPTCAVAEFSFDTQTWSDVGQVKPAKADLDYPKK
jgi:phosphohistidine phosphatase